MKNKSKILGLSLIILVALCGTFCIFFSFSKEQLFASEQIIKSPVVEFTELNYVPEDIVVVTKSYTGEILTYSIADVTAPEHTNVDSVSAIEGQDYVNAGSPFIKVILSAQALYKFVVDEQDSLTKEFIVPITIDKAVLNYTSQDISVNPKTYTGEYISFGRNDVNVPKFTTATGLTTVPANNYYNAGSPFLDVTLMADANHKFIVEGESTNVKAFRVSATINKKELTFTAVDVLSNSKEYTGNSISFKAEDIICPDNVSIISVQNIAGQNYVDAGTKKLKVIFEIIGSNHIFMVNEQENTQKSFEIDVKIKRKLIDASQIAISKSVVYNSTELKPTNTWFENVPNTVQITNIGAITKNDVSSTLKNVGNYKVQLTLTANSNYEFANSATTANVDANVSITSAHLTLKVKTDYVYQTGTKFVEQKYSNSSTFTSNLVLNKNYFMECNSTAILPELTYYGLYNAINVGTCLLTINFELQNKDLSNYVLDNSILSFNGKIIPATAEITFGKTIYAYTYNTAAEVLTATTNPTGLPIVFKYSSDSYVESETAPILPGNYKVTAYVSGNYEGTKSVDFIIRKMYPSIEGLSMNNQSIVFNNTAQTITINGNMPTYLQVTFTYQRKLGENVYGQETSTQPQEPGIYKVIANFSVKPNNYYADFENITYLQAYLSILATDIAATTGNNNASGSIENENGIDADSKFEITKSELSGNIQSSPMGYSIIQSYTAKLYLNNEEITPTGKSIIIVTVDNGLNLDNTKLLVYENGKVEERNFIFKSANEIAFYSNGLGEFAIAYKASFVWLFYASAGILGVVLILFMLNLLSVTRREKKKEEPKQNTVVEEKLPKADTKILSRQEEIEKLLNLTSKRKK